jgi:lysophospholipase L1-like esterase
MRSKTLSLLLVVIACGLCLSAFGQLVEKSKFNPPPAICCPRIEAMRLADRFQDINQLGYYYAANERLKAQGTVASRVVFLGDSITEGWKIDSFFPNKPYVNRGVSGQTTSQMLVRTFQDVIDLHPAAVIVLAGTNDIAANNGPETMQMVEENIQAITELAQKHGIKVILCSVLPVNDYPDQPQTPRHPKAQIAELNNWFRKYAEEAGALYCDYDSAVADENGFLKQGISSDGLHPNAKGYDLMVPVAEASIQKALAAR